jgi:hypothetical protein
VQVVQAVLPVLVILSALIWLQDMVAAKAAQTHYQPVLSTVAAGMVMVAAGAALVELETPTIPEAAALADIQAMAAMVL